MPAAFGAGNIESFDTLHDTPTASAGTGPAADDLLRSSGMIPNFAWEPDFPYEEYILGPGDVLNVHLWGSINASIQAYVSTNYELVAPPIGAFSVRGIPFKKVREQLQSLVGKRYRNAQSTLAIYQPRSFLINVSGNIRHGGGFKATSFTRLHAFLDENKILIPSSSRKRVILKNSLSGSEQIVDYQSFLQRDDATGNPFLHEGDEIVIPAMRDSVTIEGAVVRPGRIEFDTETTLSSVVETYAGGLTVSEPAGGRVVISRNRGSEVENMVYSWKNFFDTQYRSFQVKDGDKIFFGAKSETNPGAFNQIFVNGEVRTPGAFVYQASAGLNHYLSSAGGLTTRGNYESIKIYKSTGETKALSKNVFLEPGDTIYVPEKTFKFWQDHLLILTTLLTVVTTTIAINK